MSSSQLGVLVLLGIGPEGFALWSVFTGVNGVLQHSNIDFRAGWPNKVLTTVEVRRVHHGLTSSHSNYGHNTMLWDLAFGTYREPPEKAVDVGAAGYAIPDNYLSHLAVPFALSRFESTAEKSHGPDTPHRTRRTQTQRSDVPQASSARDRSLRKAVSCCSLRSRPKLFQIVDAPAPYPAIAHQIKTS